MRVAFGLLLAPLLLTGQSPSCPAGTVIVTNMNDHTATILDAGSGAVLATLTTGEAPHEVAVSSDGRWAVVSNYGVRERPGTTLTVIDIESLKVTRTIDLSPHRRPHGMAFLPGDSLLAVTSEASQAVLVVSFADGKVASVVPTGGRASHMVAVPPAGPAIAFTANIADGTISRLDLANPGTPRVLPVARQPEGIAVSPDGGTVWVGSNGDKIVVVMDAKSGQPIDTLTGFGMPYRMAITPDGGTAVVSDPIRGEVRILDARTREQRVMLPIAPDSLVPTTEVPGSAAPEGVAVTRDSRWAFVTLQGRNRAIAIDLSNGRIVWTGVTGTWSDGIGYSQRRTVRSDGQ
jgi:DNA-binding beta-propeller fold protein YncE